MIWFIYTLVVFTFCSLWLTTYYFDCKVKQLEMKTEKLDMTITELCKIIDKNFLKLSATLDKKEE